MILKLGKASNDPKSYRPISLLSIPAKLLESLLFSRLLPIIEEKQLIPNHQFGFRRKHSTIDQIHRIVDKILKNFENRKYCSTVFLDVAQAFDKVWHEGLLFKIKQNLPANFYILLRSYLQEHFFLVKQGDAISELAPIHAGVPQGSVLGPVLYLLYTSDLPKTNNVTIGTFADNTVLFAAHENPDEASKIQESLNKIEEWTARWRIKVNEAKSAHVTFILRRETCPSVKINRNEIPQCDEVKFFFHLTTKKLILI